ncbi:MAG: polynucleotide adenylyltransferase PcnB [Spirochaetaceae bacterium]|nr:polynucleotide adenylyltransferase PcnB [Spirochaetaceae bacterium]
MRVRYSAQEDGTLVKKAVVYTCDEHGIDAALVDSDAVLIVKRLRQAGYEGYIVGGAVRDLILNRKPKDFDIVSNATPSQIRKLFRNSRIIGQRFQLVHVALGNKIFEVCTFRSLREGSTGNVFGTIEEDVLRRDFTINALFYEPTEELVVDYIDGLKDMQEKRIKPIIPLAIIFQEDPVRMIRAVKYSVLTNFKLPATLKQKIQQQAALLANVSSSRLTEELFKIIHSSQAQEIVDKLNSLDLYQYLQYSAAQLMQEDAFRTRYLSSLSQIVPEEPGSDLAALVRDYLNDTTDWQNDEHEIYKSAFHAARHFILPMSPPRVNLDKAVRLIFKEHGIAIKQAYYPERIRQSVEKLAHRRQHRHHRQ